MTNYFGWKGKSPKLEHFLGQENLKIRRWRTGQEQGHEWEFGHGERHSKKTEATSPVCVFLLVSSGSRLITGDTVSASVTVP